MWNPVQRDRGAKAVNPSGRQEASAGADDRAVRDASGGGRVQDGVRLVRGGRNDVDHYTQVACSGQLFYVGRAEPVTGEDSAGVLGHGEELALRLQGLLGLFDAALVA